MFFNSFKFIQLLFDIYGQFVCSGNITKMSIILQDDVITFSPIIFKSNDTVTKCCEVCTEMVNYTTRVEFELPSYRYGGMNTIFFLPDEGSFCISRVSMRIFYRRIVAIKNVVPKGGPVEGNADIVVYGVNPSDYDEVYCKISSFYMPIEVTNDTQELICKIPPLLPPTNNGTATLVIGVRIKDETVESTMPFLFFNTPAISNVTYNSTKPGDFILIQGRNFINRKDFEIYPRCMFDLIPSPSIKYIDEEHFYCEIPSIPQDDNKKYTISISLNLQQWIKSPKGIFLVVDKESSAKLILWIFGSASGFTVLAVFLVYKVIYSARKKKRLLSDTGESSHPLVQAFLFENKYDDQIDMTEIKLGARIGKGSFGEVYLGIWQGTTIAVKKLPAHRITEQFLKEFTREANLMKSLRHPNVLQFLGASLNPPDICIITEYMPLGSLNKLLHDKNIEITWEMKRKMAIDSAKGMAYLHYRTPSIIHRDLKSHNLLVDEGWKVKVCDFGLSRIITEEQQNQMTACGTPSWTAPEILQNSNYTTKADVYSFAIVLWEMASREEPYSGMPPFQVLFAVANKSLRPQIPDDCPLEFRKLIERCWHQNPDKRPDFKEIIEYLEECNFESL